MDAPVPDIPPELKDILVQFSVSYLIDNPSDIIDYAVEYFSNLQYQQNLERTENLKRSSVISSKAPLSHRATIHEHFSNVPRMGICDTDRDDLLLPKCSNPVYSKTEEEKSFLYNALKEMPLFRSISKKTLDDIVENFLCEKTGAGEYIYREGDSSDIFYIVESGILEQHQNDVLVDTYNNSGAFGDMALLCASQRVTTVKSITDTVLWKIDRDTFRNLLIHGEFESRLKYEDIFNRLDIFQKLSSNEKINLADAIVEKEFTSGKQIYAQGGRVDGMHFIKKGSVMIHQMENQVDKAVLELRNGDHFGEIGLLTGSIRNTSAYAIEDVTTYYLDISAFNRLIGMQRILEIN